VGHIKCSYQDVQPKKYQLVGFGPVCMAEANNGFRVSSWTEDLGHNWSRPIQTSISSFSPYNAFLSGLGLIGLKDNAAIFNVTRHGNFTTNFDRVPAPIPSEYWVPLYAVMISAIVGWSIPSIVGWFKTKIQVRRLDHYYKVIRSLYDDGKLDQIDIGSLDKIKDEITDSYARGKITEQQYEKLKYDISMFYEERYNNRGDSLNIISDETNRNKVMLQKVKNEIADAYAKGRIMNYIIIC
jgi:hypothetical protein